MPKSRNSSTCPQVIGIKTSLSKFSYLKKLISFAAFPHATLELKTSWFGDHLLTANSVSNLLTMSNWIDIATYLERHYRGLKITHIRELFGDLKYLALRSILYGRTTITSYLLRRICVKNQWSRIPIVLYALRRKKQQCKLYGRALLHQMSGEQQLLQWEDGLLGLQAYILVELMAKNDG